MKNLTIEKFFSRERVLMLKDEYGILYMDQLVSFLEQPDVITSISKLINMKEKSLIALIKKAQKILTPAPKRSS